MKTPEGHCEKNVWWKGPSLVVHAHLENKTSFPGAGLAKYGRGLAALRLLSFCGHGAEV